MAFIFPTNPSNNQIAVTPLGQRYIFVSADDGWRSVGDASNPAGSAGIAISSTVFFLGAPISITLSAASSGTSRGVNPPFTFIITSGNIPTGINLSSTGLLSGTPTVANEQYSFTISVLDSLSFLTNTLIFTGTVSDTLTVTGMARLLTSYAPINSPAFVGTPTVPTPNPSDSSQRIASTEFVASAITLALSNYNITSLSSEITALQNSVNSDAASINTLQNDVVTLTSSTATTRTVLSALQNTVSTLQNTTTTSLATLTETASTAVTTSAAASSKIDSLISSTTITGPSGPVSSLATLTETLRTTTDTANAAAEAVLSLQSSVGATGPRGETGAAGSPGSPGSPGISQADLTEEATTRATADLAEAKSRMSLGASVGYGAGKTWLQATAPNIDDMCPVGANRFINSAFTGVTPGAAGVPPSWSTWNNNGGVWTYYVDVNEPGDHTWHLPGEHTVCIGGSAYHEQSGLYQIADATAGQYYEFSAYVGSNIYLQINYEDAAGTVIFTSQSTTSASAFLQPNVIGNYTQLYTISQAPAGATQVRAYVIWGDNVSGVSSSFITRPFFGLAYAGQTTPSTWIASAVDTQTWLNTSDNNSIHTWQYNNGTPGWTMAADQRIGLAASAADLQTEAKTRSDADGALSSLITDLASSTTGVTITGPSGPVTYSSLATLSQGLKTTTDNLGDATSSYTLDVVTGSNGVKSIGGIKLISSTIPGTTGPTGSSAFIVQADQFEVIAASGATSQPIFEVSDIGGVNTVSITGSIIYNGVAGLTLTFPPQTTWYVDFNNGSDTTGNGKTTKTAWATLQHAVDTVSAAYVYSGRMTIQCADGMHTNAAGETSLFIGTSNIGSWYIVGNTLNPSDCYINATATGARGINADGPVVYVAGFQISAYYEAVISNGHSNLFVANVNIIGSGAHSRAFAAYNSSFIDFYIINSIQINISGSFDFVFAICEGSLCQMGWNDITSSDPCAFNFQGVSASYVLLSTSFATIAIDPAYAVFSGWVYGAGRYYVDQARISVGGAGVNFIPGTSPGVVANNGIYV